MQRALFHAARGSGRTSPNPLVGAVVVLRRRRRRGAGFSRARRRTACGDSRAERSRARGPAARRCTARSSRAAIRDAPDPASAASSTPASAGWWPPWRIRIPRCAAAASRSCARTASQSMSALRRGRRRAEPAVLHPDARRPAIRDFEGGDEHRRPDRGGARRADRAHLRRCEPPRPPRPRGSGCDCRRQRHAPRRRSGADAARRLSRAAAGAGGLRPAAAHAADRACPLDTGRRACHHRDDRRAAARAPTCAARSRSAARTSRSRATTRFARRSTGSATAASARCCSRVARPCMAPRGTNNSSTSCGCTSRRTCSAATACRCSAIDRSRRRS